MSALIEGDIVQEIRRSRYQEFHLGLRIRSRRLITLAVKVTVSFWAGVMLVRTLLRG